MSPAEDDPITLADTCRPVDGRTYLDNGLDWRHQGRRGMTKAKIKRLVDAVIEAARKNGAPMVEVKIDDATVKISLAPDKPIAELDEVVL